MNCSANRPSASGLFLAFCLAILVGLSMVTPSAANPADVDHPQSLSVKIPVGPYKMTPTAGGHEIFMEGYGYRLIPGEPALPSKIFAIEIPPGAEVVDVVGELGPPSAIPGAVTVAPAPLPRVIGEEDPALYARDLAAYQANHDAVYQRDDAYPGNVVELVRRAGYRGHNLVDVRVTPFSYHPLSGRLVHYRDITVHVNYTLPAKATPVPVDYLPRTESTARDIVLNYDQARAWQPPAVRSAKGLHDFVIITLDSLTSSVTPLVDWETFKGRNVEVVTTSWIDSNYTGYDLAEKIRNFLREKYPSAEWGIEDVFLIGHYDDVPMRRTAQDVGYGAPETDYYYAELSLPDDESWDADEDHQYGENSDPIDFYTEVNVGRIPWSSPATVLRICAKSVAFEQNEDPAFKKNMLLLGGFFWANTDNAVLMETKVDLPWMADWTMTRMYEKNADYSSSYPCDYELLHSNVMSVWPTGNFAFVNWAGHGSPTSTHIYGLGAPAFITASDSYSLSNEYPAIIFADACSNSDTDYLNIGQAMLEHGAVGFVGATKVAMGCPGWSNPYSGSSQSLDYFFTTGVTSGNYTQGQALQEALREMYTNGLWNYNYYETFEWGALWGNPNLRIGLPPLLTISLPDGAPEYLEPYTPTSFSVEILDGVETYVPGTGLLHYRYDGGVFQTLPLTPLSGSLYEATLPGTGGGSTPEFYVTAQGNGGCMVASPSDAPTTTYTAIVGTFMKSFEETLDSDPGWSMEEQWAFGQPTGGGGEYGGPDPTSGHTGNNVYGYNLGGDYPNNMSEQHLTSNAIDCSERSVVTLKFWRWLGVEQSVYDHAYVRVSNDGSSWTTVWENSGTVTDAEWTQHEYDLSAVADGESTVYLRWTMGTSDGGWRYCGWNIDDVELWALVTETESCEDGILNQNEVRIDCGGVCPPCECTADGTCDDGLFCTGPETCDDLGQCQTGHVPCPAPLCHEDTDTCDTCLGDGDCDDGLYCNGVETCDGAGVCQPGTPVDCTDGTTCTVDSCNETTMSCDNVPDDELCDNGMFCDGQETCDVLQDCQPGDAVDCDDGVDCTIDLCNDLTDSCDHNPNDGYCSDDLFCTGAETCDPVAGCLGGTAPCLPDEMCRESDDQCVDCLDNSHCDDGDVCNGADVCNGDGVCVVVFDADCNSNGVEDFCDIDLGTCADCNSNGVPDECDIASGSSQDVNENGIPDECDAYPPAEAPAPHAVKKNRYISFASNNDGRNVAFRVEMMASEYFPGSVGVLGWVSEPDGNSFSRVVDTPYYSDTWPMLVHVGGCKVVPAATYAISATPEGIAFSSPLMIGTIVQPAPAFWADCVGAMSEGAWTAPNGVVNFVDVTAAVQYFISAPTAPHLTWVDIEPQEPNAVLNFADIMQIVYAFQGATYPFSSPADCP